MIGLVLVVGVALALLTPVFAVRLAKSAQRHHWKAPAWLRALVRLLRAVNSALYVGAVVVLLVMAIWLIAHSK